MQSFVSGRYASKASPAGLTVGVSCERQIEVDDRIPLLQMTPSARRTVTLYPLLGPIDLTPHLAAGGIHVVAGGPEAERPADPSWADAIARQCAVARVPFIYSNILHHAAKRGWCPAPIIERPDLPPGRIRWLTIDEADGLISACSDHLRPMVIFMLYTGARTGEALWLDWRDVDLGRAHVQFPKTKNGDARGVPLHPRAVAALANLKGRAGEVFRRPDGKPYSRPRSADDTSAGTRIKTAFKAACRRAGIVNFHPHDCRHTWATWHYTENRDLGGLMKLGGWKSERMVMRYAHVNVGELQHTINKLPGGNLGDYTKRKARKP
jgi:integrase